MQGKFLSILILVCSVFGIISCNNSSATPAADEATAKSAGAAFNLDSVKNIIEIKSKAFAKALINGDSATLVNSYTTDAKLFPPNEPMVEGKAAIGKLISQYLKYGIKEFYDSTTAAYGNEDNVVEEGYLFMGDAKGNTMDKGKYVEVWRKENGEWKLYTDIWNTNLPATPVK
jgi:ketosteroid isomerase-like protein